VKEVQAGKLRCREIIEPRLYARSMLATALNRPVTPAMKAVIGVVKTIATAVLTTAVPASNRS